jgi:cbb3-type cytochrome oxidase subunit 3
VSFILTAIGTLLFLLCLAGISFGVFMAVDRNTREAGWLFALGWVPAVAAAGGVLMRDAVTFTVGLLCFLIAGTVFILEEENLRRPSVNRRARTPGVGESLGGIPSSFEAETTEENKPEEDKPEGDKPEGDKPEGYGRAVS